MPEFQNTPNSNKLHIHTSFFVLNSNSVPVSQNKHHSGLDLTPKIRTKHIPSFKRKNSNHYLLLSSEIQATKKASSSFLPPLVLALYIQQPATIRLASTSQQRKTVPKPPSPSFSRKSRFSNGFPSLNSSFGSVVQFRYLIRKFESDCCVSPFEFDFAIAGGA